MKQLRALTTYLLIASFTLVYVSCAGGGTSGTGGQNFLGRMVSSDQTPLANVTITILESGDSGVTDANGNFLIEADTAGGDLNFEFVRSDINTSLLIPAIPADAELVTLELEYSPPENKVTPKKIEIKERPRSSSNAASSKGTAGNSTAVSSSSTSADATSSTSTSKESSSKSSCRPRNVTNRVAKELNDGKTDEDNNTCEPEVSSSSVSSDEGSSSVEESPSSSSSAESSEDSESSRSRSSRASSSEDDSESSSS